MRSLLVLFVLLAAPACAVLRHTSPDCEPDSGACKAEFNGDAYLQPCHWHHVSVAVDPGTTLSRALARPGAAEVPVSLDYFLARWLSLRAGIAPGAATYPLDPSTWPSTFWLGARLYQCNDEGCGWFATFSWEVARRRPDETRGFVMSVSSGYRFEDHFEWGDEKRRGMHLFAAPAVAVDLLTPGSDGALQFPLSLRFQLELGWAF